ncbi:F-box protein At3g07870-like [Salvia splendens]|uniref:F-box protein At3g07870-like n=1 Tax=Salvia splendens TaxID=180675 RepID=UPI001C278F1F|nr:F-box protein At3g07870-like [Salvia splendens]
MGRRDFFTNLQSDITIDILSRLPLESISISKCVCKSWLTLLNSNDFKVKTPPALVCLKSVGTNQTQCTIFEILDEEEEEADLDSHEFHYITRTDFDTPHTIKANGLLLLYPHADDPEISVYICNPITREYISLCPPEGYNCLSCFQFCASRVSRQYKVVYLGLTLESDSFQVYTLGIGIWRPIETGVASGFRFNSDEHVVCNGNLHWIVDGLDQPSIRICGFDAETERFSIFSAPPTLPMDGVVELNVKLTAFRDCLCICYAQNYSEIVIWLMKEYHVEESWTIEYKLSITFDVDWWVNMSVYPIKVFRDGDVMMLMNRHQLIYYFNKTRTSQQVGMFSDDASARYYFTFAMIFTPSLFSLRVSYLRM